jgi:Zn-dependent M16 (insulinase) family peptidase
MLAGLGDAGSAAVKAKAAELERFQEAEDPPEKLARIPHLSRSDLSPEIDHIPRRLAETEGVPVLIHDIFTNRITYIDLAFPLDIFEPEDYRWFPLFSKMIVSMGLPDMDYGEVSSLMARTLGGFYAVLECSSPVPEARRAVNLPQGGPAELIGRDWLIYRVKALDEKTAPGLEIAARIILEADFTDVRRIKDILAELKNDLESSLPAAGHSYASTRAGRRISRANTLKEIWRGISQFLFIQSLTDADLGAISGALARIRDTLASRAGLIVNLTGSGSALDRALDPIGRNFGRFGAPRPSNQRCAGAEAFHGLLGEGPGAAGQDEVYTARSLCNVGFAGMTVRAAPFSPADQAVEKLLAHALSTSELWEDIRMKGGAYGAFANADIIESAFEFSTYRDPNPLRSLDAFSTALKRMGRMPLDAAFLEKSIIGEYARETRPLSITDKSIADFIRFLIGFEDRHRAERRKKLLALSAEEIKAAASRLAKENPSMVIITGAERSDRAAAALGGVRVRQLV